MVIEHCASDYGNNAFTWSFLILHSVSSRCRSDFSSCNAYLLPCMTACEGFSHMSICHTQVFSAICAIRLWHAAVMQGKGQLSVKREPSQQTPCLSALFPPTWRFYQSPGQLEVVEGEFFTLWGNVNCQQLCSADVVCEMDGWMDVTKGAGWQQVPQWGAECRHAPCGSQGWWQHLLWA